MGKRASTGQASAAKKQCKGPDAVASGTCLPLPLQKLILEKLADLDMNACEWASQRNLEVPGAVKGWMQALGIDTTRGEAQWPMEKSQAS